MEKHDTIIIGAGPGSLTVLKNQRFLSTAKELTKKDRDVLILEKTQRDGDIYLVGDTGSYINTLQ